MLARFAAFVVWALVAATAVFWGLRLFVRPQPAPSYAVAVGDTAALRGDLSRLLGATPAAASSNLAAAAPELASRFRLIGVMAGKESSGAGFALIAVDAKPARAYAVGAALDGDLVLQSVSLRSAAIGPSQGTAAVTLEIPPLPAPATGTLPGPADGLRPAVAPPAAVPRPLPVPQAGRPNLPGTPGATPEGQPPAPLPLPGTGTRTPGLQNR